MEAVTSCFCIVERRRLLKITFFQPRRTLASQCQCLAHYFILSPQRSIGLASYLHSSSPCRGVGDPVQKSRTAIRAFEHLADFCSVHCFQLLYLIFLFHLTQPVVPFLHGTFPSCTEPSFLAVRGQQFANPPTAVSIHSFFCSDCLSYPSLSTSVEPSCILLHALQIVPSEPNEDPCPTVFTPSAYSMFLASSYQSPFQKRTPYLCRPLFCCLPPCTCSRPLPHFYPQFSSSIHPRQVGP